MARQVLKAVADIRATLQPLCSTAHSGDVSKIVLPAPHTFATSLHVRAPRAAATATVWLVTPVHRHTNMALATRLANPMSRGHGDI
ncbi:MAG: hypothetical protein QOH57_3290 [Mycobacterium sp.]|jgi:hypothetical protein|nr:hypothetical protein [Mycobacterium sp.]